MKYALEHYYGDIVRYLFLSAGLLMLLTLPLFQEVIRLPIILSVLAIAILGIAAGLTNPKQKNSAIANFIIAMVGFIIFAYSAVNAHQANLGNDKFLLTNVLLAVIFLFALYFSMKTLRAQMLSSTY
ncbi:MAG TPA: hypothetical protein PKD79_00140 [Candidatus Doudnabacteria bacterium]|nr:hypothetical protein [Candidatus Doudnabacteria bacterium]